MVEKTKVTIGIVIAVFAIFSGFTLEWQIGKDWTTLYNNGSVIAREKWVVNAERSWFALDSYYDKSVKCPKIIKLGGHKTATRCYYPDDYYEQLSRSLINTDIYMINRSDNFSIMKKTPIYKYGTRGSYTGYLIENMTFMPKTFDEKKFPNEYNVYFNPKDTRNYRLTWRIENLKDINLSDGIYHNCKYEFGNILIDLLDECNKLDYAEVISGSKIYFYFKNYRGEQDFNVKLVDPIWFPDDLISTVDYNYTFANKTIDVIKYHMVDKSYNVPIYRNESYEAPCNVTNETGCYTPCINFSNSTWCQELNRTVFDHYDTEWHMVNESYQEQEQVPDNQTSKILGVTIDGDYYKSIYEGGMFFYNDTLSTMKIPPGDRNWLEYPTCRGYEILKDACIEQYFGGD